MFADYHVHTSYSDDSEYLMEDVVRDAISLGMDEICFTDHVDYGIKRDWDDPQGIVYRKGGPGEPERMALANVDYPRYAAEITSLQSKYRDRITIKMGLEFGMQQHTVPLYEKLFASYPFDFIIQPIMTEILKTVIADGKGLEVNTSCYRYGIRDLTPAVDILKLYRDLGGKIITIGSDSHRKEHLGAHIPETMQEIKKIGFDEVYTFSGMVPIAHAIIARDHSPGLPVGHCDHSPGLPVDLRDHSPGL